MIIDAILVGTVYRRLTASDWRTRYSLGANWEGKVDVPCRDPSHLHSPEQLILPRVGVAFKTGA